MFSEQTWLVRVIWMALLVAALIAATQGRWSLVFVSLATLTLSLAPLFIARMADVVVPASFAAAVVVFVAATVFLGEVFDFYERFWWWDIAMHGGSAVGFGLIGFCLVFMMFQGDRYEAPHFGVAVFAFCFAATIGTLWELFEFAMDAQFGLNMQKSGLTDTMGDLAVDLVGAAVGAASGYAYLAGIERGGPMGIIAEFVRKNPRLFRRKK